MMPKVDRERVIPAIAKALINWKITSNQSRTFSLMETLAIAVSDNANALAGAIRAKLVEETERPKAKPLIDETAGGGFICNFTLFGYMTTETESADALQRAEDKLKEWMLGF